jgi:hypothetical protein
MPIFVKGYIKAGGQQVKSYTRGKKALRGILASGKISGRAAVHTSRALDLIKHDHARSLIKKIKSERAMYGNVFQPGAGKSHLIKRVRTLNARQRALGKYLR